MLCLFRHNPIPALVAARVLMALASSSAMVTRYRRVLLTIPTAGTPAGNELGCRLDGEG